MENQLLILVDADSCPVKQEIYKIAIRHQIYVKIIANNYFKIPENPLFESIIVQNNFDAADDYIASNASINTIIVTSDILLASRCLKANASVLAPNGKPFTNDSIGTAIATRAIMEDLRAGGEQMGGAAPFSNKDRSNFSSKLHEMIVKLRK